MKRFLIPAMAVILAGFQSAVFAVDKIDCWFPPSWKTKPDQAKKIAKALSDGTGTTIRPRIANSYPQILSAFESGSPSLVYVGSFVQAIIKARALGEGLAQSVTGKEYYSGVFVYNKDQDPQAILREYPEKIAYAVGASSGESSAKAATGGKAAIAVKNHKAAAGAVKAGKAKGAVVKNWWWKANSNKFPGLKMYKIPGISIENNPDNVLTASKSVPPDLRAKIKKAAMANKAVFKAQRLSEFNTDKLEFSISLMKKGKIDPKSYNWK